MSQNNINKKQNVENVEVTVPNSEEFLDALEKAATHRAHFAAIGGWHFTLDDAYHAASIPVRKEQNKKIEKCSHRQRKDNFGNLKSKH